MNHIIVSNHDNYNKYIGTHSGSFQADEVLAIVLLKILPKFKNHIILRTRTESDLKKCEVVVDVGMEYNLDNMRFDHHQQGFNETFNYNFKTKLSSAGLIYKHFGLQIIQELCKSSSLNHLDMLYNKIYRNFIEEIDANDNGLPICDGKQNYIILTNLSSRISHLNPTWNEESSNYILNNKFKEALEIVEKEFKDHVYFLYNSWLPAYDIVKDAIKKRYNTHIYGNIILLNKYCPWELHLKNIEYELRIKNKIKFVIYESKYNNSWNIHIVKQNNILFPQNWRGLEGSYLSEVTNIPDCIFIHINGLTGSNKTLNGAALMCNSIL